MVDQNDSSSWVYDPRYDNVERWYKADLKRLNPSGDGTFLDKPFEPVATSSFGAWKRSVHSPNAGLILHSQKFWVHDASEARRDDDGQLAVTCTCGLVVTLEDDVEVSSRLASYRSKFFAGNHGKSIEWQREFFEHPGHRDPFHKTVLGAFLARIRSLGDRQLIGLELRCVTCGWLPLGHSLSGDWRDFDKYAHRYGIDMHNIYCPQPGTDFWDGDMYLWGHGPSAAYRARQAEREREFAETAETETDGKDVGDSDA